MIFTQLISRLSHPERPEEATQTLILAHRTELVQQAAEQCRRQYPNATIEIEMASAHSSGMADITVASIASITSGDRLLKFDPTKFKLILIDEAHHAVAARYMATLDHFGVLHMDEGKRADKPVVVGVSATLARNDGLALAKVLDYIVYHRDYVDMIEDNWLSQVKFTTVKTNVDLSRVKGTGGDFAVGELSKAVNTETTNEITVRSWLEKAQERKSTIVFCVDIAHVEELTAKFRQCGINAHPVTSNTPPQDRRERLDAFRKGEYQVLVNCGVFTEGTDIPNIDCVLLARPTKSRNLLVQMIGRGMRLHPGKKDCHIIDMVGSVERGIVTVPTLLGLDPDEILEGESIEQAKERISSAPAKNVHTQDDRPATVTFDDYPDVFSLLADSHQDKHVRRISQLAWVAISGHTQILSLRGGHIKISPVYPTPGSTSDPTFIVTETIALPIELTKGRKDVPFAKPRLLAEAPNIDAAVRAADTYALSKYPRSLLIHAAPWRSAPATEGQLKILSKMKLEKSLDGITKGKAGDMITRMKHGGMARWNMIEKERRRVERENERDEKLRARGRVEVGALLKHTPDSETPKKQKKPAKEDNSMDFSPVFTAGGFSNIDVTETLEEALGLPAHSKSDEKKKKRVVKLQEGQQETIVGKETKAMLERANAEWSTAGSMDNLTRVV